MARIFPKATSRGRYFMPQSGATMTFFGLDVRQRAANARRHLFGGLDTHVRKIDHADHDLLALELAEHRAVELRLRGLDRDLLAAALRELGRNE